MKFAKRMDRLGTETAFEVLHVVNLLKAGGRDIVSFCIGEPDFDTPKHITEEAVKSLKAGDTHYTGPPGYIPFREAAAKWVSKTRGIEVLPDMVIASAGGKPIITFAMMALVEEGDEVIYPNPGYPIYESAIDFCGAKAVPLPLVEEKEFSFRVEDLKRLVTPKTKMIVLNSPHNPTGGIIPREDLEEVAKLAVKNDIWVLADEIYSQITYDGKHESILQFPGMQERTILLEGHSKAYAMCGWRLGFGVMPPELAVRMARLVTNTFSCVPVFTQKAGIAALEGDYTEVHKMVKEFKERRDLIVELLNDIPGFKCHKPHGAFYAFPNVTECVREHGFKDSEDLMQFILHKADVAVLSRMNFGRKNEGENEEYIRLSYATSKENIREGLKRIKDALADKKKVEDWLKEEQY